MRGACGLTPRGAKSERPLRPAKRASAPELQKLGFTPKGRAPERSREIDMSIQRFVTPDVSAQELGHDPHEGGWNIIKRIWADADGPYNQGTG